MINLNPKHAETLRKIFELYCPDAEIWAYGSRVNGNCHNGSDLDLAVIDFNDPRKCISELKQLINDSNIPFLIDIAEYHNLPLSFQNKIKKNGIVFFKHTQSL